MRISDWSSDVCSSDLRRDILALQLLLVGIGDGVHHEVEAAPGGADPLEHPVDAAVLGDVAGFDQRRSDLLGQRPDALLQRRSEEHTSELQSLMRISYAVFCLKKKIQQDQLYTSFMTTE